MASDSQQTLYAFDCGTTNWRIYRLSCEQDANGKRPLSDPQRVALTTFKGSHLPAALLLDERGPVRSYGDNAYEQARDAELRPYLRDAFKLCLGNRQSVDPLEPRRRYTHQEALDYTRLLLEKVIQQLGREKPGSLDSPSLFFFAHPVHWGRELADGVVEGEILPDFVAMVRSCFPAPVRENVHFVTEPEAALMSLTQSGQLQALGDKLTLVIDVGGGTTDFVAGCWTAAGLQDVRTYGEAHGGGLFDSDLAAYVAEVLRVPEAQRTAVWTELCHHGRELKEALSRQMRMNDSRPAGMKIMLEVAGENSMPTVLSQRLQFSREEFEARTQKTVDAFERLVLRALVQMDLRRSDIGQVVLVGGGANLYLVPRLLAGLFEGRAAVVYGDPPEETIVRGAALWVADVRPSLPPSPPPKPEPDLKDPAKPQPDVPKPQPTSPVAVLTLPDLHGWSAAQVQQLQKETAQKLGLPVAFYDPLKDGGKGPDLLVIPPGSFLMGSPANEAERRDNEEQHRVEISKPFAIGRYAVTFAEYDAFCAATGREKPNDQSWGRGNRPVINIDWPDAWAYADWLTQQTGQHYRLPTEAEWEYAARAGTTTVFWWGNSITPEQANYDGNYTYNNGRKGVYRGKTVAVGEFQPNPWGLYQVHGNVWEWTGSEYQADYSGSERIISKNDANKIAAGAIRGGSWFDKPARVRSAYRALIAPATRDDFLGARLARDL